jgi:hypothetical protein
MADDVSEILVGSNISSSEKIVIIVTDLKMEQTKNPETSSAKCIQTLYNNPETKKKYYSGHGESMKTRFSQRSLRVRKGYHTVIFIRSITNI